MQRLGVVGHGTVVAHTLTPHGHRKDGKQVESLNWESLRSDLYVSMMATAFEGMAQSSRSITDIRHEIERLKILRRR
mgnify:FL=1